MPPILKDYYLLTKPGIVRGNLLTAIGGFFLASQGHISWRKLLCVLVGTAMVIGAACALNNIYDRNIDKQMARTQRRALVSGTISVRAALSFAIVLGLFGTLLLIWQVNILTAVLGLIGLVTYVGVYTPAKHRTPYATLLGTIPGAVPPVAGYTAITNRLDVACLLLFLILICWQMPHFYAIAIRRQNEYKAASVPVWPEIYGLQATWLQMSLFGLAFVVCVQLLSISGYSGLVFSTVLSIVGLYWTYLCYQGLTAPDPAAWAKKIFLVSLPILPLFCVLLIANNWLF